jgi:ESCRT-I complex subunit VPS28
MTSLNKCQLPPDFDGNTKMITWIKKLNQMRAADTIDETDARQLIFDLESAYGEFHAYLQNKVTS